MPYRTLFSFGGMADNLAGVRAALPFMIFAQEFHGHPVDGRVTGSSFGDGRLIRICCIPASAFAEFTERGMHRAAWGERLRVG